MSQVLTPDIAISRARAEIRRFFNFRPEDLSPVENWPEYGVLQLLSHPASGDFTAFEFFSLSVAFESHD